MLFLPLPGNVMAEALGEVEQGASMLVKLINNERSMAVRASRTEPLRGAFIKPPPLEVVPDSCASLPLTYEIHVHMPLYPVKVNRCRELEFRGNFKRL